MDLPLHFREFHDSILSAQKSGGATLYIDSDDDDNYYGNAVACMPRPPRIPETTPSVAHHVIYGTVGK